MEIEDSLRNNFKFTSCEGSSLAIKNSISLRITSIYLHLIR